MTEKLLEPELYEEPPEVCPKANCEGKFFIPHEDGWQCFNCMKIIYRARRFVADSALFKRYQREKN